MRRRAFIALLGAMSAAWPTAALTQQRTIPVVGFVSSRSAEGSAYLVAAFRQGLTEAGYHEGENVAIEYRWADGGYDRLPGLVADLVNRHVAVIAAATAPAALAAKAATTTIPIVFEIGADPIRLGLVASLSRPEANVTGVSTLIVATEQKRIQLLRELFPKASLVAILANPNTPDFESRMKDLDAAAKVIGLRTRMVQAAAEGDFDATHAAIADLHADALIVASDPFFVSRRERIVELTARLALPAIYEWREYAIAGGLLSYGTSLTEAYRQAGRYASQILKGAKPADLPVMQSTKFELVINLKTAKALGLEVPPSILARADEVIE
jgi:putative ABC transport system substrate-binding protein